MPGFSGDKRGGEGAAARLSGLERRQTVNKTKQFSSTKAERGAIYHQALRARRGGGEGGGAARKLMFVVDATASICTQMEVKKKKGKKKKKKDRFLRLVTVTTAWQITASWDRQESGISPNSGQEPEIRWEPGHRPHVSSSGEFRIPIQQIKRTGGFNNLRGEHVSWFYPEHRRPFTAQIFVFFLHFPPFSVS